MQFLLINNFYLKKKIAKNLGLLNSKINTDNEKVNFPD